MTKKEKIRWTVSDVVIGLLMVYMCICLMFLEGEVYGDPIMGRKTKWMDESTGKRGRKAFVYKGLERLSVQRPEKRNGLHCFTSA